MWWYWLPDSDLEAMVYDFTVHNDPGDFSDSYGLYLMVHFGEISGSSFYFGLQTDVYDPGLGPRSGQGA